MGSAWFRSLFMQVFISIWYFLIIYHIFMQIRRSNARKSLFGADYHSVGRNSTVFNSALIVMILNSYRHRTSEADAGQINFQVSTLPIINKPPIIFHSSKRFFLISGSFSRVKKMFAKKYRVNDAINNGSFTGIIHTINIISITRIISNTNSRFSIVCIGGSRCSVHPSKWRRFRSGKYCPHAK